MNHAFHNMSEAHLASFSHMAWRVLRGIFLKLIVPFFRLFFKDDKCREKDSVTIDGDSDFCHPH